MHLTKTLLALVALAVPNALANFHKMSVPSVIVKGKPFNISGAFGVSDKAGAPIAAWLGVLPFNAALEPNFKPPRNARGLQLNEKDDLLGRINKIWPYYFTFEGFVVPAKLTGDTFYLQWTQVIEYGAYNYISVQSFLMGPIKAGTEVSTKLIDAKEKSYTLR